MCRSDLFKFAGHVQSKTDSSMPPNQCFNIPMQHVFTMGLALETQLKCAAKPVLSRSSQNLRLLWGSRQNLKAERQKPFKVQVVFSMGQLAITLLFTVLQNISIYFTYLSRNRRSSIGKLLVWRFRHVGVRSSVWVSIPLAKLVWLPPRLIICITLNFQGPQRASIPTNHGFWDPISQFFNSLCHENIFQVLLVPDAGVEVSMGLCGRTWWW